LVMISPVDGLRVGKVLPEAESTHLLLMSSLVAEIFTVGSKTADAVAMAKSSLSRGRVLPWGGGSKNWRKSGFATESQRHRGGARTKVMTGRRDAERLQNVTSNLNLKNVWQVKD